MVEAWLLPRNQHDSEAGFVSHHASVSFCGICQWNGFDHRSDVLQRVEGKRVLRIYGRPGHCSGNRTRTEKKRDRLDANRFVSSRSGDNNLAPKAFGAGRVARVLREAETSPAVCRCSHEVAGPSFFAESRGRSGGGSMGRAALGFGNANKEAQS